MRRRGKTGGVGFWRAALAGVCLAGTVRAQGPLVVIPELAKEPVLRTEDLAGSVRGLAEVRFGTMTVGGARIPATRVFLGYTATNLYALFVCAEPKMEKVVADYTDPVKHHDMAIWKEDCVEMYLAPNAAEPGRYFQVAVNAKGVVADLAVLVGGTRDESWKAKARTRAGTLKEGDVEHWFVEVVTPFETLGRTPKRGEAWRGNFTRQRKAETTGVEFTWAMLSGSFHQPGKFRTILFGEGGATEAKEGALAIGKAALGEVTAETWREAVKGLTAIEFDTVRVGATGEEPAVRVYLGRDEETFQALFVCAEPKTGRIAAKFSDPKKDHDAGLWNDDCVELYLATDSGDFYTYHQLMVNSKGVALDLKRDGGTSKDDKGWTSGAKTRTWVIAEKPNETGYWLAEVKIPFASLGGAPKAGEYWQVNFTRQRKAEGSQDFSWAPIRGSFHQPDKFRAIVFP